MIRLEQLATMRAARGKTLPLPKLMAILAELSGRVGRERPVKLGRIHPTIYHEHEESLGSAPTIASGVAGQAHDILADRLDDEGDPRATIVRNRLSHGNTYTDQVSRVFGEPNPSLSYGTIYTAHLPDGTLLNTRPVTNRTGSKAHGFVVSWVPTFTDDEQPIRAYASYMSPSEYQSFRNSFPTEHHNNMAPPSEAKPAKLARAQDAITWVGGRVPGGQRAIGFWPNGTEQSTVLRLPADQAPRIAPALAAKLGNKTALWFVPGTGPDTLHVLRTSLDPRAARAGLAKHAVSYMTVIPSGRGSIVQIVDPGSQQADAIKAFASQSGAQYTAQPGTASFVDTKI